MEQAQDILLSTINEGRPLVLVLGHDAWYESIAGDPVLSLALDHLNSPESSASGWLAIFSEKALPRTFYDWLSERFERRIHPNWFATLADVPWSAIFTSTLDPTFRRALHRQGREPELILTSTEKPRAVRSQARPPLYYLFSHAGSHDPAALPPKTYSEFNTRKAAHAIPMLNRVMPTATSLGTVVIEGFISGGDWIRIDELLGTLGGTAKGQILWFGGEPQNLSDQDSYVFREAVSAGEIIVEQTRLGTMLASLQTLNSLCNINIPTWREPGIVSFRDGQYLETKPDERLRVEAVASIVDDTWTAFLHPLEPDTKYDSFRRFHGGLGGPRLLVEGILRNFSIQRDFENNLLSLINSAIEDHAHFDSPIIIHGQSGTGKSVALARAVAHVRRNCSAAVLYATNRVPQAQEIANFCERAERAGAAVTLIVCDTNRNVDLYQDLFISLRSSGRRIVLVGSQYRILVSEGAIQYSIEAEPELSSREQNELAKLLRDHSEQKIDANSLSNTTIFAFLYRYLPSTRPRIGTGLGKEARFTEERIRARGRIQRPIPSTTEIARQLIELGLATPYKALFSQTISSEQADNPAGLLVDLVMVAGRLNCSVPLGLLIRTVADSNASIDRTMIVKMFSDLDLFRWAYADFERSDFLVSPRLALEAELICDRRLGNPEREAKCLVLLISSVRGSDLETDCEIRFLVDLLQQISESGPTGARYYRSYVEIARALTTLRTNGILHPSLVLQESAFRRAAIRNQAATEEESLPLLEEARDAVQSTLEQVDNGSLPAGRHTYEFLLVERASLYGYLASNCARRGENADEIWSAYLATRTTIRKASNVTNYYYPLDVGLWTPLDLLKNGILSDLQQADLRADIYATVDQVDTKMLPASQKEKFGKRRMQLGRELDDSTLSEVAYQELLESGSTAGFFLRAREFLPPLSRDNLVYDEIQSSQARKGAKFLRNHFDAIKHDERCMYLLLEYCWIAEMGRRPLRGERQPLPASNAARQDMLAIVRDLNDAADGMGSYSARYLEAVLNWCVGNIPISKDMFASLSHETENLDPRRVVRRHIVSDKSFQPLAFRGRVERRLSPNRASVRVENLNCLVNIHRRDFAAEYLERGREVRNFSIAFNFIGPIAEPLRK